MLKNFLPERTDFVTTWFQLCVQKQTVNKQDNIKFPSAIAHKLNETWMISLGPHIKHQNIVLQAPVDVNYG
jgi:hypothetical protein